MANMDTGEIRRWDLLSEEDIKSGKWKPLDELLKDASSSDDLMEFAWGIIANAGGGDWTRESADWQEAAARWRTAYFKKLDDDKTARLMRELSSMFEHRSEWAQSPRPAVTDAVKPELTTGGHVASLRADELERAIWDVMGLAISAAQNGEKPLTEVPKSWAYRRLLATAKRGLESGLTAEEAEYLCRADLPMPMTEAEFKIAKSAAHKLDAARRNTGEGYGRPCTVDTHYRRGAETDLCTCGGIAFTRRETVTQSSGHRNGDQQ